ncbi:MAG TPA: hypothetical protein ENN41_01475 [Sediminispirochaeta sp.]|nr:hypothetical protein [Sediminispirochaeta sp.]
MIRTRSYTPTVDEEQVRLRIAEEVYNDFFCTPQELTELCIGHLYLRGKIHSADDVVLVQTETKNPIEMVATILPNQSLGTNPAATDNTDFEVPGIDTLREAAAEMFSMAEIYKKWGGIHCSALLYENEIVAFKEDIGRHNAMDKVIGQALIDNYDISKLIYLTSGRVNAEIISKAATAGLPLIVSRSIVSTIALETARRLEIGLIGRIEWEEPIVYEEAQHRMQR